MKILGIDVAKDSVVCCLLSSEKPIDIRKAYRDSEIFMKFDATAKGFQLIGEMSPQYAVLEPTGGNYSRLWKHRLEEAGVTCLFVGHAELSNYRKALGLPDKDDEADALALAKYGIDFLDEPRRFLSTRIPETSLLKDRVLALEHYARIRNALINRIKQNLAWQFPEIAGYSVSKKFLGPPPLLWRWMAGLVESKKYERLYKSSCGQGLTPMTRRTAKILLEIYTLENTLEKDIEETLKNPIFAEYLKVFSAFDFGVKLQALLISEIYPIQKFFGKNNKPEIIRTPGKKSGKITKKDLSKRRFKKFLGCAPVRHWSGDSNINHKKEGSSLVRTKLYLWILCKLAVKKTRPQSDAGKILADFYDELKASKMPTRKAWAKVRTKLVEILYAQLIRSAEAD